MTDTLTDEQIAELGALAIAANAFEPADEWDISFPGCGTSFNKVMRPFVAAIIPKTVLSLISMAKRPTWLCFNCSFGTSDRAEAEAHFGEGDGMPALCLEWSSLSQEDRLKEYQSMLVEIEGTRGELHLAEERADIAECEAIGLRVQADELVRIAASRERNLAIAVAARDELERQLDHQKALNAELVMIIERRAEQGEKP